MSTKGAAQQHQPTTPTRCPSALETYLSTAITNEEPKINERRVKYQNAREVWEEVFHGAKLKITFQWPSNRLHMSSLFLLYSMIIQQLGSRTRLNGVHSTIIWQMAKSNPGWRQSPKSLAVQDTALKKATLILACGHILFRYKLPHSHPLIQKREKTDH